MKIGKFIAFFIAILIIQSNLNYGQGCSDAGFCTLNSLIPDDNSHSTMKNKFKIGFNYGAADHSISAIGNYIEFSRELSENLTLTAKVTSLLQTGNDISEFGLSDLFISSNTSLSPNTNFTLGAKIPLHKSDKSKYNLPLPMDYQSSLGTFDIIAGFGFEIEKFQISAAAQIPLSQNDNKFIASNYPLNSELREIQSTNNFERAADLLLRISYPVLLNENYNILVSLLPIYHLSNDKYTDQSGIEKEIDGSKGLTLNANIFFNYKLNKNNSIQLNFASPLIIRDARPDGLTRSLVANFEYSYKF